MPKCYMHVRVHVHARSTSKVAHAVIICMLTDHSAITTATARPDISNAGTVSQNFETSSSGHFLLRMDFEREVGFDLSRVELDCSLTALDESFAALALAFPPCSSMDHQLKT